MQPNSIFLNQPSQFWAHVKYVSEQLGYSDRSYKKKKQLRLKLYKLAEIKSLTISSGLDDVTTQYLYEYLNYRATILNERVQHLLMNREEAKNIFDDLRSKYKTTCQLPFNKQKGAKKHPAYFTCIVNILTEQGLGGREFEDDPGNLATIYDSSGKLVETLSRRIDGAYPSLNNPQAIWEIKEYYGTTTFGSRVADGVYETQLDGFELKQAEKLISHKIRHYLLVDDKFTWWECGRSYLCRLIDIMHTGLADEVIFGREVLERWPPIVSSWLTSPG